MTKEIRMNTTADAEQRARIHLNNHFFYGNDVQWTRAVAAMLAFASPVTPAAATIPEGWRLVPVEPTQEMANAGDAIMPEREEDTTSYARWAWREMLAASPIPPATIPGGEREAQKPKRGDKIKWARSLDRRPLAVQDAEFVTVASWGLPDAPLALTLQEVAGTFPMGWFDVLTSTGEASDEVLADAGGAECHICKAVYPAEHGTFCSAAWPDDPKRYWPGEDVDPAPVDAGGDEIGRLRKALIECGRNVGCILADDVSTDFLMHIADEVRLKVAHTAPVAGEGSQGA